MKIYLDNCCLNRPYDEQIDYTEWQNNLWTDKTVDELFNAAKAYLESVHKCVLVVMPRKRSGHPERIEKALKTLDSGLRTAGMTCRESLVRPRGSRQVGRTTKPSLF